MTKVSYYLPGNKCYLVKVLSKDNRLQGETMHLYQNCPFGQIESAGELSQEELNKWIQKTNARLLSPRNKKDIEIIKTAWNIVRKIKNKSIPIPFKKRRY